MVECPKCGSDMRHIYNEEQIEYAIKDITNQLVKNSLEFKMRREFICIKKDCSLIKTLSNKEIIQEYAKVRKEKGLSDEEILKEVKDEIKRKLK